jgi:Na+-driven multidrug efflux pump
MSGWTAYIKVDQLLFLPMQSVALAVTTFVGQNLGANLPQRARKGVTCANLMTSAVTILLMIPVVVFAPDIVRFFNSKPEVVETGTLFLRVLTPFYVLCGFNQVYAAALRGSGNSIVPMIMMLSSFVAFRQAYLFIMSQIWNEVIPISMAYPAGWLLCSVLTAVYFYKTKLEKNRLVDNQK